MLYLEEVKYSTYSNSSKSDPEIIGIPPGLTAVEQRVSYILREPPDKIRSRKGSSDTRWYLHF